MVRHPKHPKHPDRKLFVEGGGDKNKLQSECRKAFRKLLEKSGFVRPRMFRIVACGARTNAYDQFCTALEGLEPGDLAVLLVDSEGPVTGGSPWDHVKEREGDGWDRPDGAGDEHLHLMVQCMEAWFLADLEAMRGFFGNGFCESRLPANPDIEAVGKTDLYKKLEAATKDTKKGAYGKGAHSFKLLERLDPARIREASPWAERFFKILNELLP